MNSVHWTRWCRKIKSTSGIEEGDLYDLLANASVREKKMRPVLLTICLIPISRIALDIINLGSVLLLVITEIELHIHWNARKK